MPGSAAEDTQLSVALASVARAIAQSLEVREVWERVALACRTIVPFDALGIVRLEAGDKVRAIASWGEIRGSPLVMREFARADFSPNLWPRSDRFSVIVRDAERELDPSFSVDRRILNAGGRSLIRLPLGTKDQPIGSLLLASAEPDRFDEAHGRSLVVIAELVAVALAHQGLAEQLAEESRRVASETARAAQLERRVETLAHELEAHTNVRALGEAPPWREVLARAAKVAATETTVLLAGESGTGKEVIARFIHRGSPRKGGPFVALNCAALPDQLLESELFGHEKGAFTGAVSTRAGRIEQAAGGVLFLDEVAEMSAAVQAKVLRVLQEREYERVGGTRTLRADLRVLAATNRDLKAMVARGGFREDLYYRLAVFDILLPPLRERRGDVALLGDFFLAELARSMGQSPVRFSADAREKLSAYAWPGNVRELRNVIERALILCDRETIESEHLPLAITSPARAREHAAVSLATTERQAIEDALARAGNNQSKAARLLGLTRAQLRSRIERHGISIARD